jgi:hypothetical protein
MSRYQVSTRHGEHVEVDGGNWLVALGLGLDALGVVASIDRLACEVLPGGTVIIRDVRTGERFVVQSVLDASAIPADAPHPDDAPMLMAADDDSDGDSDDSDSDDSDSDDSDDVVEFPGELLPLEAPGEPLLPANIPDLSMEELALPEDEPEDLDPRIEALLESLEASTTTFDAWKLALEGARQVCGAESGAALCREEDGALRFLFAVGPRSNEVLGRRLPPGRGIAGFCTQRDVGLLITEPARDPRFFSSMDQTTGSTTTAVLAVPVATEDEMLGCLELLNAPSGFRSEQLEQLSVLAMGLAERLTSGPA